jgi:hypothetical protein
LIPSALHGQDVVGRDAHHAQWKGKLTR